MKIVKKKNFQLTQKFFQMIFFVLVFVIHEIRLLDQTCFWFDANMVEEVFGVTKASVP